MGFPTQPPNVRPFVTLLSADLSLLKRVRGPLCDLFGEILILGDAHAWDYSPAYSRELGGNITRQILVFGSFQRPERLPDWKLSTIELEQKYYAPDGTKRRRINIDPGYLGQTHVILASTKRYNNRVYLRDGIYADLTLYFDGKSFVPVSEWTLPDYRTRTIRKFFTNQRHLYLRELEAGRACVDDT